MDGAGVSKVVSWSFPRLGVDERRDYKMSAVILCKIGRNEGVTMLGTAGSLCGTKREGR